MGLHFQGRLLLHPICPCLLAELICPWTCWPRYNSITQLQSQVLSKRKAFCVSSHRPEEHAAYYETTNQLFYEQKPAEARQKYESDPIPEKGDDARFVGKALP